MLSSDTLLPEAAVEEQVNVAADRDSIVAACRGSLDFLASFILTELYAYGYPEILKGMWQLICASALKSTGKDRFALGIPRGFSKTILLKLYVVWVVLFTKRRFILVVCATETHAVNFLNDVTEMLSHINVLSVFGNWLAVKKTGRQDLYNFSFRGRDIILAGLGAGGSPRGLNINYVRPDVVIMDDIQKREEAPNLELSKELMQWMLGTLMKACDPHTCTYIFVANMYPFEGSILRKLKRSREWISIITGAITADGCSIWPEHRDVPDLMEELRVDSEQGHPEIFFSEVMNDEEAGTVSGIDVGKIHLCPAHVEPAGAIGGFVIIDPSLGKKKSDNVAIGLHLVFDEGKTVLWEVSQGKFNPGETIIEATTLAMKYNVRLIIVEAVAYQETLAYWFKHVYAQQGISGFEIRTVSPEGIPKNTRIRDWLKRLLSGQNWVSKAVRNAVIYQVTQWNPLKTNNVDDLLDVGAYGEKVLAANQDAISFMIDAADPSLDLPPASFEEHLQIAF